METDKVRAPLVEVLRAELSSGKNPGEVAVGGKELDALAARVAEVANRHWQGVLNGPGGYRSALDAARRERDKYLWQLMEARHQRDDAVALLREWERWMRCEIKNAPRERTERTQALLARLEGTK